MKGIDIGYIVAGHKAGLGMLDLTKLKVRKINV
jgi:hypothetical protein